MMKKEKRKRERGSFAILLVTRTKNSCHEGRLVYVYEREESEREISIRLSLVRRELPSTVT